MRFSRIIADLKVFSKQFSRNKIGVFFTFIFPVILIILFGAIFSGSSSGSINLYVQNQDNGPYGHSFLSAVNETGVFSVVMVNSSVNLSQYLLSNSYSDGLVIPSNFSQNIEKSKPVNVILYGIPDSSQSTIVSSTISGVIVQFNFHLANTTPILGYEQKNINLKLQKYINYLVPGLIGFAILTSPMFSVVNISAEYKKIKLFKQLSITPLTKSEWLTSKIIWYIFTSSISFIIITLIGKYMFGSTAGFTLGVLPFIIFGPFFFVSLGMLVGSVTKSQESAGVVGNIITFPMMFLSGTFFPISMMPQYLQVVAHVFPLYYLIQGLSDVMIFNNIVQASINILILIALTIIVFIAAIKAFKWKED
jgi:ABC-2 type transport system permease protein